MRDYEFVFVVKATETDEAIEALVESCTEVATKLGAEVVSVDRWGRRKLAYEIGKQREGYYVLLVMRGGPEAIPELERRMRMNDTVLRYLTVRLDEEKKRGLRRAALRAVKKGVPVETLAPPPTSAFRRDVPELDGVLGGNDDDDPDERGSRRSRGGNDDGPGAGRRRSPRDDDDDDSQEEES